MKYSFRISEEEYLAFLRREITVSRRDPFNILAALLCTVVQLGLIMWGILAGLFSETGKIALTLAGCILFAGMTWYQLAVGPRARRQLARLKKSGCLYQDFSSVIRIRVDDGVLIFSGGKNKLSYDCAYFTKYQLSGNMLALFFSNGKDVHRILIPVSAFGGPDGAAAFACRLAELGEADGAPDSEAAECAFSYESTRREFTDAYVRCCRTAYRTGYMLTASFFLKLLLAALLIWYVARGTLGAAVWNVLACVAAFLLISRPLAAFSPLMRYSASRYADNLYGESASMLFRIAVTRDYLSCSAESFRNRFGLDKIVCAEKNDRYLFVYMQGGVMLAVPVTPEDAHDVSRCYLLLSGQAKENRQNRKSFAALRRRG